MRAQRPRLTALPASWDPSFMDGSVLARCAGVALAVMAVMAAGCSSSGDDGDAGRTPALAADAAGADATLAEAGGEAAAPDAADAQGPDATLGDAASSDGASDGAADADAAIVDAGDCAPGDSGEPTELRCTGLYSDWATKTVSADVMQFDPGLHLWSDGAKKTRWVYLPPADGGGRQPIDTTNMDEWTFPVGTKFWKEFVLEGRRIETRLLWKREAGVWYRTTYRWSDDESTATELTTGEVDADGQGYEVPTQEACFVCHKGRRDNILGFEAVSLSSPEAGPNIDDLADAGLITHAPDAAIVIPGNPLDVAALGYLHANCGTACHNAGSGLAGPTGFHMRLDVATLASVQTTDAYRTGVDQGTSNFTIPGSDQTIRLVPYDAGASCVYYRMSHRDGVDGTPPVTQMPPIDTHKVDEAGVALIGQWIDQGCQ
jgi:hypothetical protein